MRTGALSDGAPFSHRSKNSRYAPRRSNAEPAPNQTSPNHSPGLSCPHGPTISCWPARASGVPASSRSRRKFSSDPFAKMSNQPATCSAGTWTVA